MPGVMTIAVVYSKSEFKIGFQRKYMVHIVRTALFPIDFRNKMNV